MSGLEYGGMFQCNIPVANKQVGRDMPVQGKNSTAPRSFSFLLSFTFLLSFLHLSSPFPSFPFLPPFAFLPSLLPSVLSPSLPPCLPARLPAYLSSFLSFPSFPFLSFPFLPHLAASLSGRTRRRLQRKASFPTEDPFAVLLHFRIKHSVSKRVFQV